MKTKNFNEDRPHFIIIIFSWSVLPFAFSFSARTSIDYSNATPDVAFTYDRLGRPLTITDVLGTRTNEYSATSLLAEHHPDGTALLRSYDPYGRPSGLSLGTNYAVTYAYDPIGNRTTSAENGVANLYAANELNQYTTLNPGTTDSTAFAYDADGNMTPYGDLSFFWDAENRLIGAASNGNFLATNRYDFMSRRFRFCSKYLDNATGLCDYGHRFYSSMLGRWLSRDPLCAGSQEWMALPSACRDSKESTS